MRRIIIHIFLYSILCVATACDVSQQTDPVLETNKKSVRVEYIFRKSDEKRVSFAPPTIKPKIPYPWEKEYQSNTRSITKEYFRCKGSSLNPPRSIMENSKEIDRIYDCGGSEKHSLPIKDEKEFIYPILIELLNLIQMKTKKQVIITSGHRCPVHNTYLDQNPKNSSSKHLIGAEVDFFVQGLEEAPEIAIQTILDAYSSNPAYKDQKELSSFKRYDKESNLSTLPWFNKEIFIKIHRRHEGRNWDNRHPYPYITIQVRYDKEANKKVAYTNAEAQKYLRF